MFSLYCQKIQSKTSLNEQGDKEKMKICKKNIFEQCFFLAFKKFNLQVFTAVNVHLIIFSVRFQSLGNKSHEKYFIKASF